ncbi:TonB-dependent receptor [Aurantiacibacter xanthus]|uniref:TonB-dependent receptor n=1 Tax=Aurantiacibacter xanthus TaxID=1784712 RepID=A0A3A1P564_9SPHN|nr:TonB-dependent receptor [Aurantiacibacter xanthus]RIV85491.1 TonB-dependent receptor [Aurantiacibacter xanthus]
MRKSFTLAPLCAFSLLLPATAQASEDVGAAPDQNDERIVVTANRTPVSLDQVGQSVTVLTEAQIEASQKIGVTELIALTPGVQFRRNGGPGTVTSVFIRGADSGQTLILYDGVRLHDPSSTDGGATLSDVTTSGLGRIEILRGTQSVLYGSQAIGGVINIISKQPSEPFEARFQAEAGELNSYLVNGSVGGKSGGLTWNAGASHSTSDGVSAFAAGTERDGYKNSSLNGRIGYAFSDDVSLDLRTYYAEGDVEYDSFNGDGANRGLNDSWASYAGVNFRLFDRLSNRVSYGRTEINRINLDETNPIKPVQTFDGHGRSDRFEYQGTFDLAAGSFVVFGVEYAENEFDGSSATVSVGDNTLGFYGNVTVEPVKGLTLTGGLRHEDHSNFGGATVGAASVAYTPNDGETVLRASYSEGFKAPGLFQLYAPGYGTPDLRPEESKSWEVGGEQMFGDLFRLSAVYFNRETENLVSYVGCGAIPDNPRCASDPNLYGIYANQGLVDAEGVELGAGLELGGLSLSANYTYLDAQYATPGDPNKGKQLTRRAKDTFNATASYTAPFGLNLATTVSVVGDHFNDAANTVVVPGYTTVDLRTSYPINDAVEIYARVENLFDEDYQTILNYGAMPRMIYGGVRVRL